jgi:hypothetical protein
MESLGEPISVLQNLTQEDPNTSHFDKIWVGVAHGVALRCHVAKEFLGLELKFGNI